MSISSFNVRCEELCSLVGYPLPDLGSGDDDLRGMKFPVDGWEFLIYQYPRASPGRIRARARLGALPEAHRAAGLRRLLELNFLLAEPGTPTFGCDPASGDVLLQQMWPVERVRGHDILPALARLAQLVHEVRQLLIEPAAPAPVPAATADNPHWA